MDLNLCLVAIEDTTHSTSSDKLVVKKYSMIGVQEKVSQKVSRTLHFSSCCIKQSPIELLQLWNVGGIKQYLNDEFRHITEDIVTVTSAAVNS